MSKCVIKECSRTMPDDFDEEINDVLKYLANIINEYSSLSVVIEYSADSGRLWYNGHRLIAVNWNPVEFWVEGEDRNVKLDILDDAQVRKTIKETLLNDYLKTCMI